MNAAALALHQLAAIVWVGGMVFAYTVLRPAVPGIEPPPERLKLWARVFERFFIAVWLSVAVLPATGFWLVMTVWGGMATTPIYVHLMLGLYLIMLVIWLVLYFRPYARFTTAVADADWDTARPALEGIRKLVFVNMKLGLLIAIIAAGGRYW